MKEKPGQKKLELESEDVLSAEQKLALQSLEELRSVQLEPSTYMKTRVLANVRAQQESRYQISWLWAPALAVGLCLFLVFGFQNYKTKTLQAPLVSNYSLGQPYLVRFDIRALKNSSIAYAEVSLGNSKIQFTSKKFLDIQKAKKLVVDWEQLVGKQYLPVVIKGMEKGNSHITVHFYNEDGEVVDQQNMVLNFKKSEV